MSTKQVSPSRFANSATPAAAAAAAADADADAASLAVASNPTIKPTRCPSQPIATPVQSAPSPPPPPPPPPSSSLASSLSSSSPSAAEELQADVDTLRGDLDRRGVSYERREMDYVNRIKTLGAEIERVREGRGQEVSAKIEGGGGGREAREGTITLTLLPNAPTTTTIHPHTLFATTCLLFKGGTDPADKFDELKAFHAEIMGNLDLVDTRTTKVCGPRANCDIAMPAASNCCQWLSIPNTSRFVPLSTAVYNPRAGSLPNQPPFIDPARPGAGLAARVSSAAVRCADRARP